MPTGILLSSRNSTDTLNIEQVFGESVELLPKNDFVCFPLLKHYGKHSVIKSINASTLTVAPKAEDKSSSSFIPRVRLNPHLFQEQISWISHVGYHAVLLERDINTDVYKIAELLNTALSTVRFTKLWLRVPCTIEGWLWWNSLRTLCGNHPHRLQVALETPEELDGAESACNQWISEPIGLVIMMPSMWESVRLMGLFAKLTRVHNQACQLIDCELADYRHHKARIQQYTASHNVADTIAEFASGYEDVLQSPLQPLMDNLDKYTYEVFMQDPVKYQLYQEAVYFALQEKCIKQQQAPFDIMVVGAGHRGPLVSCVLRAVKELGCERLVRVYAIEKNPNALITLEQMCNEDELWLEYQERSQQQIRIIGGDVRSVEMPVMADIMVSELLGSFGDNELSPECLYAAQRWLKPQGCSIPQSSTPFITPLSSHRLHWNVSRVPVGDATTSHHSQQSQQKSAYETPYVCYFYRVNTLLCSQPPQPVWTFTHPDQQTDSERFHRSARIQFTIANHPSVIHGFAGYFESVLYESATNRVLMSTLPETHSPDMTSWFPIYFPLQTPVQVNVGDSVELAISRHSDTRRVWYEWAVSVNGIPRSHIHNSNGNSCSIGLH